MSKNLSGFEIVLYRDELIFFAYKIWRYRESEKNIVWLLLEWHLSDDNRNKKILVQLWWTCGELNEKQWAMKWKVIFPSLQSIRKAQWKHLEWRTQIEDLYSVLQMILLDFANRLESLGRSDNNRCGCIGQMPAIKCWPFILNDQIVDFIDVFIELSDWQHFFRTNKNELRNWKKQATYQLFHK